MGNLDALNQIFLWFAIYNWGSPDQAPPPPPPSTPRPAVVCQQRAPVTYDSVMRDLDVSTWKPVYTAPICADGGKEE